MQKKILIIEDEADIVRMLEYNLKKEGFRVIASFDGLNGLRLARKESPDIVLLDLMLPQMDGLEVTREIKKAEATAHIPIIMLTAKAQETDKVVGLELGADDYITKPFSPRELIARIKAVLRRKQKAAVIDIFHAGDLHVDFGKYIVKVKGKDAPLTSKEFEVLKMLTEVKGRVLSRQQLLDAIWGFNYADEIQTRTVDVHVASLRKKLKSESKRIITVKSAGYRFDVEA